MREALLFFKLLNESVQLAVLDSVRKVEDKAYYFKNNEVNPGVRIVLSDQGKIP